jgi:excisionase family DNA binding protein
MAATGTARKSVDVEEWLTVQEAAAQLGIHRQTVLNRALAGGLTTIKIAGRHFVSRASVEAARALAGREG